MPRLLQDITARQVYELPDFDGPVEQDFMLKDLLDSPACKFPDGTPHRGNLLKIPTDVWDKNRERVLKEIWRDFPDMGDDDILRAWRNTFLEDAMECFNKHHRPDMGCPDYCDSSKRIGSPSKHPFLANQKPVYLCYFCPVHTWVTEQNRYAAGQYNE
jgi:hypothetical protein